MISKDEAFELTMNFYTWQQAAEDFIEILDNNITYNAQRGKTMLHQDLPQTSNFTDAALALTLEALGNAGYTDIYVDSQKTWIEIKWGDDNLVL